MLFTEKQYEVYRESIVNHLVDKQSISYTINDLIETFNLQGDSVFTIIRMFYTTLADYFNTERTLNKNTLSDFNMNLPIFC